MRIIKAITLLALVAVVLAECWTCAAGWTHWYSLGWSQPSNGDRCQCVQNKVTTKAPATTKSLATIKATTTTRSATTTTTKSPATTTTKAATTTTKSPSTVARNCWSCGPGYSHWYDLGMDEPADPCACVATTAPTVVPTSAGSATTTTKSPSSTSKTTTTTTTAAPTTRLAQLLAAMTPSSTSTGSVSFSAGVGSYSPWNPPPSSLVSTLLDNLVTNTKYKTIMTYSVDATTTQLAQAKGLKVLGIIYIVPGTDNSALINAAITVAKAYPDTILGLACGNEQGSNYGLVQSVVDAVAQCATMLRAASVTQPIGVIDTYYAWCSHDEANCKTAWTAVSQYADWIGLNDYMFYDNWYSGVYPCNTPTTSPATQLANYKRVANLYGKPVIQTEFGWAASGSVQANSITGQSCSTASEANQKTMIQGVIDLYRTNNIPCNTFEAYREPWKGSSDADPERFFGVCLGVSPWTCSNAPQ